MTWAEKQIQALIAIGVSPEDAHMSVTWSLENVPDDEDVNTWIPSAELLAEPIDDRDIPDARGAWHEWAAPEFKLLLDAVDKVD